MPGDQTIDFDLKRLLATLRQLKIKLGRDPGLKDIVAMGISEATVKKALHLGFIDKHKVTLPTRQVENRFRVKKDIFSLNS